MYFLEPRPRTLLYPPIETLFEDKRFGVET